MKEDFGAKYEVVKINYITDILDKPAMMVVINPEKLTWSDFTQINELCRYDSDTLFIFTKEFNEDVLSKIKTCKWVGNHLTTMMHFVSSDLKMIDRSSFLPMRDTYLKDLIESIEEYPYAQKEVKTLLNDIEESIMSLENTFLYECAGVLRHRSSTYKQLYELHKFSQESKEILNVPFRYEILNMLSALKLAYGMIDENSPLLKVHHHFDDVDIEWVLNLAEQLKVRKNDMRRRILNSHLNALF